MLARSVALKVFAMLVLVLLLTSCVHLPPERAADLEIGAVRRKPPEAWAPTEEGPLECNVEQAVLLALENNTSFRVERMDPAIRQTFADEERAAFDPTLRARATASRERTEQESQFFGGTEDLTVSETGVSASISRRLPTGTNVAVDASTSRVFENGDFTQRDRHSARLGLTVTQALLRGYGTDVNLANLRQEQLQTRASEYELRAAAESLVASVEATCWDYALARRRIEIFTESLNVARQQLAETKERIRLGRVAESEQAAAMSEVALRQEELINARSDLAKTRLKLLRLVNPQAAGMWEREISLANKPEIPDVQLDEVEPHVQLALRMRPELNQARLDARRGELEVVKTKNGLLPKMDVFVQLGKSGYADSFTGALGDTENDSYDALAGVDVEFPFGNRAPRARYRRATRSHARALAAVSNLEQTVQVDVRSAYIEVQRAREQVTATAATRNHREESLRAEREKFRVGKSTSFLVARAQRDLVESEIAQVEARVNYLKALIDLYRLEGSLLERRGINAPGREPVEF
ncbi:MAG: TolC family protein [Candidatus Brocadiaceae bacterium]